MAKAGRIPTIQEPADEVLRAIYRVRGTDLSPLNRPGCWSLAGYSMMAGVRSEPPSWPLFCECQLGRPTTSCLPCGPTS